MIGGAFAQPQSVMLDPSIRIAFIGGGNMAEAILAGLIRHGHSRRQLMVCAPSNATRAHLSVKYCIRTERDNGNAIRFADVVILAVKPDRVGEVCVELGDTMDSQQIQPLLISIAAGIRHTYIIEQLGGATRVICAMPNLPAAVCKGMTGLHSAKSAAVEDIALAEQVMQAVGQTVWVEDEALLPAIVAAAGSAPAYIFLFMEAMQKAAIEQGLDPETARQTVLHSAHGAVSMAMRGKTSLSDLRDQVTSQRGSTERAVKALQDHDIENTVKFAMASAAARVDELYKIH